ncbi:hypothetical protein PoB_002374700 [Plakobranchus ocellatus]|uniref:Uncharacterized protein n=1 Tax=Plakobranchus ocellatus TaxID=259542 RepID=A0AAV3ZRF9_9GAST|nr:hypothetical protein PoB_002374700 [Plakobranchus ocellatus]
MLAFSASKEFCVCIAIWKISLCHDHRAETLGVLVAEGHVTFLLHCPPAVNLSHGKVTDFGFILAWNEDQEERRRLKMESEDSTFLY